MASFGICPLPVVAEEYEVALVVERHDAPPAKLRLLREHRREHAPDSVPHSRGEVVEDELRVMGRRAAVV